MFELLKKIVTSKCGHKKVNGNVEQGPQQACKSKLGFLSFGKVSNSFNDFL